jgi:hypothetical protein
LFLHAVVGFGLFLCFTAELVGSAAKPPTAFSTIQGTFPRDAGAPGLPPKLSGVTARSSHAIFLS